MTAHLSHNSPSVGHFFHAVMQCEDEEGRKEKREEKKKEEEYPSVRYLDNFVFLGHRLTFSTKYTKQSEEVQSFSVYKTNNYTARIPCYTQTVYTSMRVT